jgi:hypothetical protein
MQIIIKTVIKYATMNKRCDKAVIKDAINNKICNTYVRNICN